MANAALVHTLRQEFAVCLRFANGDAPVDGSAAQHVGTFLDAARQLQEAFAAADVRQAAAGGEEAADLQAEIAVLRKELAEKDALLATHRERIKRWCGEVTAVQSSAGRDLTLAGDGDVGMSDAAP